MLTSSDIAKTVHLQDSRIGERPGEYYFTDPLDDLGADGSRCAEEFFGKEDYSPEILGSERIGDWMTPRVISVARSASLEEICRTMIVESIHRVLVVHNSKILGIITTFDVVRFLAGAD